MLVFKKCRLQKLVLKVQLYNFGKSLKPSIVNISEIMAEFCLHSTMKTYSGNPIFRCSLRL